VVTLTPAPTDVEAPGLGQLNDLVVISTSRQLFTAAGVVLHTLRKELKLGNLVEETDQILLRHGDHHTASTVILTTDQIKDGRKSQKILTFCFMPSATKALTIGDLEAGFSTYCQALRRLVADGRDLNAIRRTVCWDYLNRLHTSLPQDYRSPDELIQRYQKEASPAQAD
jgi:type I site-specific restriction endonuclease